MGLFDAQVEGGLALSACVLCHVGLDVGCGYPEGLDENGSEGDDLLNERAVLGAIRLGDLLELRHHEVLEQVQSARHLCLVADDDLTHEGGVPIVPTSLEELVDDPVAHLCVVSRDRDEGGLDQARLDVEEVSEQHEALLDLVDGLFLVRDHFEDRGEIAAADQAEYFERGLLLFLAQDAYQVRLLFLCLEAK